MSEHKQYDFNPSIFMRVFECTMIVFTYIYYYYKHEKSINMKKRCDKRTYYGSTVDLLAEWQFVSLIFYVSNFYI